MQQFYSRWRIRKASILLLASAFVITSCAAISIISIRDQQWSALVVRVDELYAKAADHASVRLSYGSELLPGNAWDDYLQALSTSAHSPPARITERIVPFLQRDPASSRADVESLVSSYSSSIELVSMGIRRQEAFSSRLKLLRNEMDFPSFGFGLQNIGVLCIAKARLLADAGHTREALDLLTELCLFSRDTAQTSLGSDGGSGFAMMLAVLRELRDMVQSRELAITDLRNLEFRLRLLDDNFPDYGRDLENDLLRLGLLLIREDRDDEAHLSLSGSERVRRRWQYFFSSRLQAANTFSSADILIKKALNARTLPWAEEHGAVQAVYREAQDSRDSLILANLHSLLCCQVAHTVRAALRLVLLGANYRATGEILEIDDPFGGRIQSSGFGGSLTAWHKDLFGRDSAPSERSIRDYMSTTFIVIPRR